MDPSAMVVIAKVERIAPKNAASNRHTTHPGIICMITCVPIACPVAFTPSGSDRFREYAELSVCRES